MPKPTTGPKTIVSPTSLMSGAKRNHEIVTLNTSNTGAFNRTVFRAPPSGARISYVGINNHTEMYHASNEQDTWIFNLKNLTTGTSANVTLNAAAVSLSGQTLAATSFKEIPVANGNSTLGAGSVLQLQLTVSGTPQTLANAICYVEWTPVDGN